MTRIFNKRKATGWAHSDKWFKIRHEASHKKTTEKISKKTMVLNNKGWLSLLLYVIGFIAGKKVFKIAKLALCVLL